MTILYSTVLESACPFQEAQPGETAWFGEVPTAIGTETDGILDAKRISWSIPRKFEK
jgi:hypothetical protein